MSQPGTVLQQRWYFPKDAGVMVWPFEGNQWPNAQATNNWHPPECAEEFFQIRKYGQILPHPKHPNSVEKDTRKLKQNWVKTSRKKNHRERHKSHPTESRISLQNGRYCCYHHCFERSIKEWLKNGKENERTKEGSEKKLPTNAIKINAYESMTQPP